MDKQWDKMDEQERLEVIKECRIEVIKECRIEAQRDVMDNYRREHFKKMERECSSLFNYIKNLSDEERVIYKYGWTQGYWEGVEFARLWRDKIDDRLR